MINISVAICIILFRLSRARRVIENVFGLMAVRFRILLKPIETSDQTADLIIKAIAVLHNFILDNAPTHFNSSRFVDRGDNDNGLWRQYIRPMPSVREIIRRRRGQNNYSVQAGNNRNYLAQYFHDVNIMD